MAAPTVDDNRPDRPPSTPHRAGELAWSGDGQPNFGELLQAVLAASEAIIFAKDLHGRYVLANPAFSRLLDRPATEIIGRKDKDLFPPAEAAALRAADAEVVATGRTLRRLDRLTVAGAERAFVTTKVPLRDAAGKIVGISGVAVEITDEIRLRDRLVHLTRALRAIRAVNQLIAKEKDSDRLLRAVCALLTETRGYRSAWIVLLDESGAVTGSFHSGLGNDAGRLEAFLRAGQLPECARRARARPDAVVVLEDPSECGACPLLGKTPAYRRLTARLEHEGKVYGIIAVEVRREYAPISEEQDLLRDLAGDIAFALHSIELEEGWQRARAALRESEELFRSIVENSHAGILVVDEDHRFVYANAELCRLLGRARAEIIGRDFLEFLDGESRALVADRYRRRQAGEEVPPRYEFNVVRKDGEKRRVEISATVIRDSAGRVRTVAQLLDITDRTKLQRTLAAIHALGRRLVFLQDPDKIAHATVEGARELAGMRDCALYLLNKDGTRLTLRAFLKEIPAAFQELPLDSNRGVIAAAVRTGEMIYVPDVTQDPRYLPGRAESRSELCVPLKARGRVIGALNAESPRRDAFTDVDRQLLETLADTAAVALENARLLATVQDAERRFRSVAESATDAIILGDDEGKIIFWNKAAQDIFGYTAAEVLGRSAAILIPERFREAFSAGVERWRRTKKAGFAEKRVVHPGLRKDGSEFPAEISYSSWEEEGRQFSAAIIRDLTERVRTEEALKSSYQRLQRILHGIIEALTAAVELRDPYTAGHQLRVSELAVAIAEEMGLPADKVEAIRYAALVHDIGKLAVPAEILAKPSGLTATEFALIKAHPQQAYDILKEIDFPWPVADIVLQHHERLDGSGYPLGLKDDEIVLEARIMAVADVVEAMSSHRPYRPALGIDKALEEIAKNKGYLYDSEVVDSCLRLFRDKGFTLES